MLPSRTLRLLVAMLWSARTIDDCLIWTTDLLLSTPPRAQETAGRTVRAAYLTEVKELLEED